MNFRIPLIEIPHQDNLSSLGHLYPEFNPAAFGDVFFFHASSHFFYPPSDGIHLSPYQKLAALR
jgi:hypothetical protein